MHFTGHLNGPQSFRITPPISHVIYCMTNSSHVIYIYIYCATPHSKCPLPSLLTSSPALPRSTWRLPAAPRIAHRRYTPALRPSNSSGKLWSLPRLCLCFSSRSISEGNSSCCEGRWGSRSGCGVDTSLGVYALSGYTWNFLGVHVLCFKNAVRRYGCGNCSWPGVAE